MKYKDFYENYKNFIGKRYRFVGLLNGHIVKSCWRKVTEVNDLSENPNNKTIKIIGVEIA